ncbi:MAG: dihydroorotase [Clostridiales bacterium]|nr:dihydroorotase [Clostridiales bacterium]
MKILLKNGKLVDFKNNCFVVRDVLIDGEYIERIDRNIHSLQTYKVIDAKDFYVSPGFIDAHVHLREPGGEDKETIYTGTKACAKGGFTHVFSMPNTQPGPDSKENIEKLLETIKKKAVIEVTPVASATKGIDGNELVDVKELSLMKIAGFSDDGYPVENLEFVYKVLLNSLKTRKPLITHSEDRSQFNTGAVNRGICSEYFGVDGIPNSAEYNMIDRDLKILEETGGHLHICHVSAKESIDLIRNAKLKGLNVTCEVTPHHLSLTEKIVIEKGTAGKVNPPLRTEEDRLRLIQGIKDGTVDMIATDHAPHDLDSKNKSIEHASYGFSGAETAFSVAYTYLVRERAINLIELFRLMSYNPSKVFGLKREGEIIEGYYANLTLVDLTNEFRVDAENFISKGKNTPYQGAVLKGKVEMTIYKGKIVYGEGER